MPKKVIRIYADTSVFGGVFDEEFERPSRAFFDQVREGKFVLVVSALVREELSEAPEKVRKLFEEIAEISEVVGITEEAILLQQSYIRHGIVGHSAMADALHVAEATVASCRAIVSWNFRHIVHLDKISLYNGVNRSQGYFEIDIHSPHEVIAYEDQDI